MENILCCKFCGSVRKNLNSLKNHELRCSKNPDRLLPVPNFNNKGHLAWNKGLTKDTDYRVAKYAKEAHEKARSRYPETELSKKLDDDGRLYHDYRERIYTSKNGPHKFFLTFDEYCTLLAEAGLKSSDLGYNGNHYDLARYGDKGDYTFGNCRFISHRDNVKEIDRSKFIDKYRGLKGPRGPMSEEQRKKLSESIKNSEYHKKRHEEGLLHEAERRAKLDPRFTGEHNSQTGTHWITNGIINKKLHPGQEMPEGFHFGRVVKKSSCRSGPLG